MEQLLMNWWREQWRKEGGLLDNLSWFITIAINVGAVVGPALVAAVAVSLIVPVERWFAAVAVLMGWAIQWRLLPLAYDRAAILMGVATAWILGAFIAAFLLGPVLGLVIIIVALEITLWAIGKRQALALYRAVNADDPDDEWPDPPLLGRHACKIPATHGAVAVSLSAPRTPIVALAASPAWTLRGTGDYGPSEPGPRRSVIRRTGLLL